MLTKKKKYGTIKQLKSIFLYGRSIMISAKQQVAVILCCALLMPSPARALVPVFDFMESVPLFKQVSSTTKSLSNIKSQLSELTSTLTSLGTGLNVTKFMDSLENVNDNIKGLSGSVQKAIKVTTNINDTARDKVDEAIMSVVGGQKELVNLLVDDVNTLIENNKSVQTTEKEIDQDKTNKTKEIALAMMKVHRQKSEEMTQELNDTIEDAAYVINKSADVSHKQLVNLQNALLSRKLKVDQKQKENAQSKETALMLQEQKVSDFGADMVEQAKNKYNQEYKNKLADGYNNYEKTVLAYFDGNATKDEVKQSGEILKEQASTMNVPTDKHLIKNYKEELQEIQRKTAELTDDIEKMLDEKNEVNL